MASLRALAIDKPTVALARWAKLASRRLLRPVFSVNLSDAQPCQQAKFASDSSPSFWAKKDPPVLLILRVIHYGLGFVPHHFVKFLIYKCDMNLYLK